jgi:hypothetical protein
MVSATIGMIQRSRASPASISGYWPVHSIRSPADSASDAGETARCARATYPARSVPGSRST